MLLLSRTTVLDGDERVRWLENRFPEMMGDEQSSVGLLAQAIVNISVMRSVSIRFILARELLHTRTPPSTRGGK